MQPASVFTGQRPTEEYPLLTTVHMKKVVEAATTATVWKVLVS
jgi:hypothetical protein